MKRFKLVLALIALVWAIFGFAGLHGSKEGATKSNKPLITRTK